MTDESEARAEIERGVKAFERDTQAAPLTPLQQAARPFVWVFVAAVIFALLSVVAVWIAKLPAVPSVSAKPDEIATYRDLTDIAKESAEGLLDDIFTKALMPLLLLFAGIFIGKKLKTDD